MMRKILIFFLIIITCITCASAQNNTTTNNPVLEKVTAEFYGDIIYMDGALVPAGKIITAKDQNGVLLGNYTINTDGIYGSEKPYGNKMFISVFRNVTDRTSRTNIIFVNFFIDNIRAKSTIEFKQGELTKFDIILPINKPTPTPEPTPIPTTVIPTPTTSVPTVVSNIVTTPPTPVITTTEPTSRFSEILSPSESDNTLLLYGLIGGGMILIGILVTFIIQIYLSARSSRDDVLGPEGRNKR